MELANYNSNMNNFHIYEEVGRGKDSVVYKVSLDMDGGFVVALTFDACCRAVRRRLLSM